MIKTVALIIKTSYSVIMKTEDRMMNTKIVPCNVPGKHRTGTLDDINVKAISEVLGFKPNVQDDPDKVKYSWGFTYEGIPCSIWDYKGSSEFGAFSTFGPDIVFEKLFPHNYV